MGEHDDTGTAASTVLTERHGAVAVITLNRPDSLNAFTTDMVVALERSIRDAVADPDVFGIVITGAGRGFCAGLDASALAATTAGERGRDTVSAERLPGLFSMLLEQPKPIVAAVNGVAAGGGFVLAAKCDLRFAAESASFITIFTKRGLIAEHGLTWLLPRQIGVADALDLLWSSRKVDAAEAERLRLVQRVVPDGTVVDAAVDYLATLAQQVTPAGVADTKRLTYAQYGVTMAPAFQESDDATWAAVQRPDAAEGVAAFLERRPPRFAPVTTNQEASS